MSKKAVTKITSVADLIKALEQQGFTVERARNKHWKVTIDGHVVMNMVCTPSDYRSVKNQISDLRKHGFQWPLKTSTTK